jgi:hypothetical protein
MATSTTDLISAIRDWLGCTGAGAPGPKGDKGDPGEPGAKGDKGDPGDASAGGAVIIKSFHAHAGAEQHMVVYSRAEPLHCDVVEWDDTGCFVPWSAAVPQSGYFQADREMLIQFSLNVLWNTPPDGFWVACWLMKNELPAADGNVGGEIAGYDVSVSNPHDAARNMVSAAIVRTLHLQAGDKIWPVLGSGAPNGADTAGTNGVINYFEGMILKTF